MIVARTPFFLGLLALILLPIWASNIYWFINAKKAIATVAFEGKEIAGQIQRNYSVLFFTTGKRDSVFFNTADNDLYTTGEKVTVLYNPIHPEEAHVANFTGLWMEPLAYSLLALIIILVIFLHPEIFPRGNCIQLQLKMPFLKLSGKKQV